MDFTILNKDSSFPEASKDKDSSFSEASKAHHSPHDSSGNVAPSTPISGPCEYCDDDDGYLTPTSEESRIPPARECPPAPKKRRAACQNTHSPISTPSKKLSGKRQSMSRRRKAVLLKLIEFEIEEIWQRKDQESRAVKLIR